MNSILKRVAQIILGLVFSGVLFAISGSAYSNPTGINNHEFAVVEHGEAVFNLLFDGQGNPTGPNPAFQGTCNSPVGICAQCGIYSVTSDELIGKAIAELQELPDPSKDYVGLIRKLELPGGTITTSEVTEYQGRTSEPPEHGSTQKLNVSYVEDGFSTGTGRFANQKISTVLRGQVDTVSSPMGPLPTWFDDCICWIKIFD